ncbi:MAG: APC family permease [Bacillota bacterium]
MSSENQNLSKVLGRTDVLALAFGAMIGWGWVMLAGYWVKSAGVWGAVGAFLIGAVMCIFVGLTYAELTPALPVTGGGLVFAYRAMGYKWAWVTAWATCLAYIGVAAWEGIAIATAIDYVIPIPKVGYLWTVAGYEVYLSWSVIGIVFAILLTALNYFGAKSSAVFQTMATAGLTLVGIVFVFGGVIKGNTEFMVPTFTSGAGMVAVLLMAPSMYVGFDVIPQSAEEMNIPLKQIANVLIVSIIMAASWYILMIVGISISAPESVRDTALVPVADAMAYAFGSPFWGKFVIAGALCGILTSWNGFIVGATRIMYAMGRAKMLPKYFATLHPKYATPAGSTIFIGIICCVSPLLGKNALVWFVDAASFGTVITYFMVALSFVMLRKKEPNLERPFKVANGNVAGILAVVISAFFISLFLPIGPGSLVWPYEWAMVLGWAVLGIILATATQSTYGKVSDAERELLIFSEKYARKEIMNKTEQHEFV